MTAKREFISTNEVAQILGISPFTIRRYIQLRKLKAVKLEGSYRVRRADLDDFLKAREVETEEELDAPESAETKPPLREAKSVTRETTSKLTPPASEETKPVVRDAKNLASKTGAPRSLVRATKSKSARKSQTRSVKRSKEDKS